MKLRGNVKYHRILLPPHLLQELRQSLHRTAHKHPGISKCYRRSGRCITTLTWQSMLKSGWKGANNARVTSASPMQRSRPNYFICRKGTSDPKMPCRLTYCRTSPLVEEFENVLTAIDVFSRYLFAYPPTGASANNIAKGLIDIMTKHAYLPTTIVTDKGTAFTSTIIAEITQFLGITLKCATTKHPQTIGKLERTHISLKTNLKMACGEYRRQWHKYLPLAVLNHNTRYHASIGCEPTRVFHGRVPYNILDHKLGNNPNEQITPATEFAEEIQNRTRPSRLSCNPNQIQRKLRSQSKSGTTKKTITVLCYS